MRIGLVQFSALQEGIDIRIKSMNQDDSHSWVRISYGTVKYVIDSIEDNTENPAFSQEEQIQVASTSVVAARLKEMQNLNRGNLLGQQRYHLSKKVINLLRHNQTLHREEDGAIEFFVRKLHLRNHLSEIQVWFDDRWKACLPAGGGF